MRAADGIPVANSTPAAEFYERLLGRPPDFVAIEGREVLWQVRDLAWIYVVLPSAPRATAPGSGRCRDGVAGRRVFRARSSGDPDGYRVKVYAHD